MVVKHINNDHEFEQAMADGGENKLIICDFFAEWLLKNKILGCTLV